MASLAEHIESKGKDDAFADRRDPQMWFSSPAYRTGWEYGQRLIRSRQDMWDHMDEAMAERIANETL